MKKIMMFLLVSAIFAGFLSACDSTDDMANSYKGWTMSLSHMPAGDSVSLNDPYLLSNHVMTFATETKNASGDVQNVTNITWIIPPTSKGHNVLSLFYPAVPGKYDVMLLSTTFATAGETMSITAEFSGIQSSTTITFTN